MKTRIATIFSIIMMVLCMFPRVGAAQKTECSVDKEFKWKDTNKSMTIDFDVQKKSKSLAMSFAGAIEKGTMEVSIIDSKGEKIPGFLLVSAKAAADSSDIRISVGGEGETKILTTSKDGSVVSTSTSTSPSSASANASASSSSSGIGKSSHSNSYAYYNGIGGGHGAKGVMNKVLTDPRPGKWKVLIELKNVTGSLKVAIDQD